MCSAWHTQGWLPHACPKWPRISFPTSGKVPAQGSSEKGAEPSQGPEDGHGSQCQVLHAPGQSSLHLSNSFQACVSHSQWERIASSMATAAVRRDCGNHQVSSQSPHLTWEAAEPKVFPPPVWGRANVGTYWHHARPSIHHQACLSQVAACLPLRRTTSGNPTPALPQTHSICPKAACGQGWNPFPVGGTQVGVGKHGSPSLGSAHSAGCFQDHIPPPAHLIILPGHYFTRNQWRVIDTVAIHHLMPRRPPCSPTPHKWLTVPRKLFFSQETELQPELAHT